MAVDNTITKSSSAEYFSKNLQQVGFSSLTKACLPTIKEAVDNSLDACEDAGILPEITVELVKLGPGTSKGSDLIKVTVTDNGPGLGIEDIVRVYGQYLTSSKFGRGRCSRGQQGIGISAVTTWAQLTHGTGAVVTSRMKGMKQAVKCEVSVDIKKNQGIIKNKENIDWYRLTGLSCEFILDGRPQLNGEAGLNTYLQGTTLVNPHLTLRYKLLDEPEVVVERVSDEVPVVPEATDPHPHTMKWGEFVAHSHLYGKITVHKWLKDAFSRVSDGVVAELISMGCSKEWFHQNLANIQEANLHQIYACLQKVKLMAPPTKSVMMIGEANMAKSIQRLGEVDFFSVVSRKPTICDFKPILVEVAIARSKEKNQDTADTPVQILRFANRVPLQFDKAACAISKSVESVNWKLYGLSQPKGSMPQGPYIFAVSVVSPFIKFKNASKETVDASDELVDEIRRALQQCGQRLSAHIHREDREADMERKIQHIQQFAPILVDGLCRITSAKDARKKRANEGLQKILGRDAKEAQKEFQEAHERAHTATKKMAESIGVDHDELVDMMSTDKEEERPSKKGQMDLLDD